MPPARFEPAITASEPPQTHALDREATVGGRNLVPVLRMHHVLKRMDKWVFSCIVQQVFKFGSRCRSELCYALLILAVSGTRWLEG
jgi:hypothetical protein